MAEEEKPVLEMTSKQLKRHITYDGQKYVLLNRDEVPFAIILQVQEAAKGLDKFYKGEITKEESAKLSVDLTSAISLVCPTLGTIAVELTDQQKTSVLNVFLDATSSPAPAAERQPAQSQAS